MAEWSEEQRAFLNKVAVTAHTTHMEIANKRKTNVAIDWHECDLDPCVLIAKEMN